MELDPQEKIKGCGLNYIKRVQIIIKIKDERLEELHLTKIRKEKDKNEEMIEDEDKCKGHQEEYEDFEGDI